MFTVSKFEKNSKAFNGIHIEIEDFDEVGSVEEHMGNWVFTNGEDTVTLMPMFWQDGRIAMAVIYSEVDGLFYTENGILAGTEEEMACDLRHIIGSLALQHIMGSSK